MPAQSAAAESIITDYAPHMAAAMLKAAQNAQSEEDVRYACNKQIDGFLSRAGLEIVGKHEYGLKGGRVDSKYGGVVIEYKASKGNARITPSLDAPGTKAVVAQIEQRFRDFQTEEGTAKERLFGVGCDGNMLVIVRYRGGKFEIETPQPVSAHSVERLLRALCSVGARGASYTPEQLTESFGSASGLAQKGIAGLYAVITGTANPKALTFFSQWRILFGEVCGYDVHGKNPKISKLADHYGLTDAAPAALLFAIHTYYAIFIKLLAAEIASSFSPLGVSILKKCIAAPTSAKLREELRGLEQGGIWAQLGITNFLEGDLFSWYLPAWDDSLASVIQAMVTELDGYDPGTLSAEPAESRDLLKKLYHHLFPRSVRHDLGEYYTPDWLAEQTLDEMGYDGDPDKRLLDPSCGSGTFLVMAIGRARAWFEEHRHDCGYDEGGLVERLLRNIIGFDLNPLAVMAARTNFLIAIRGLLKTAGAVELPVYLCDAVLTPSKYGDLFAGAALDKVRKLRTAVGDFNIPAEVTDDRERIGKYAEVLEECVRQKYSPEDFLARCEAEGLPTAEAGLHRLLYEQLRDLDAENKNGIWARIIKNAFAPLFIRKVDFVAGNPPWINWESLPDDYRDAMKPLWKDYGLFSLGGSAGRLGGGKKDLSMLFVYVCTDNYLRDGGRLGFVITQTIFKTKGAGDGFRRLKYGFITRPTYLKPVAVADLSALQVFEGATNRTAIFVCEKQKAKFEYPVPYTVWRGPGRIAQEETREAVLAATTRHTFGAVPVNAEQPNSPWLTAPPAALIGIQKVIGQSKYKAYAGCCTWMNGVYWVKVLQTLPNGQLLIENLCDVGKIKVECVQTVIEPDLIYPLLRGRDVKRWHAEPSAHIILAQDPATRAGIPESVMKRKYPKTYAYLHQFEEQLRGRSGFRKYFEPSDPFYSMYNVGPYSLAEHKVVWAGQVALSLEASVVSGLKPTKPDLNDQTAYLIPFSSQDEAFFFSGLLNSAPIRAYYQCVAYKHTSMDFIQDVALPTFKPGNDAHAHLADLSERCHQAAAQNDAAALAALQGEVDQAAAALWGIDGPELAAIRQALDEMQKVKPVAKGADEEDEAADED